MTNAFRIKKENANLKKYKKIFKVGAGVVFQSNMGGIWQDLGMMTGVVKKQTNDCMWSFVVEIDRPDVLSDFTCWNPTKTGGISATVHGSALILLSHVKSKQKNLIVKLNKGAGLNTNRPICRGFIKDVTKKMRKIYDVPSNAKLKIWKNAELKANELMRKCLSYQHLNMKRLSKKDAPLGRYLYECPHCKYVVAILE